MIQVKLDNPDKDIRFVFGADNKLNKNSKVRYTEWAEKNGFPSCILHVPNHWLYPNDQSKEYKQEYYRKNRERILQRTRESTLKRLYGITLADVEQLRKNQDNCCAICSKDFDTMNREPDVDHCHETGKVRGLLCWTCNGGLGQFNDDDVVMLKAIDYLRRNR